MILSSCFLLDHTKSCLGFSSLVVAPNIKLLWVFNLLSLLFANPIPTQDVLEPGGGGGDAHIKMTGMLVVSPRGANHGFWSHLRCSG